MELFLFLGSLFAFLFIGIPISMHLRDMPENMSTNMSTTICFFQ